MLGMWPSHGVQTGAAAERCAMRVREASRVLIGLPFRGARLSERPEVGAPEIDLSVCRV